MLVCGFSSIREENGMGEESSGAAAAVGAIAGLAILAVGVASLMGDSSRSSGRRTMKAPGRDMHIFRDDFEKDTASYFRNLRKK
ncbi:hypothetical protein ACJRO7_028468 [Eucalyptus globulus]|uniref:Uncharacterized protein n=1 Tax=Eucalyptus globulus TaxID=34317 RepID=A0ABD3K1J0_EUCGL